MITPKTPAKHYFVSTKYSKRIEGQKERTTYSVSIQAIINPCLDCRCNSEDNILFSNTWKLLEILWLFSGRQSKKIPDYEQTGSSDHCFRGHRISPVKGLQIALLWVSKIYKV